MSVARGSGETDRRTEAGPERHRENHREVEEERQDIKLRICSQSWWRRQTVREFWKPESCSLRSCLCRSSEVGRRLSYLIWGARWGSSRWGGGRRAEGRGGSGCDWLSSTCRCSDLGHSVPSLESHTQQQLPQAEEWIAEI